MSSRCEIKDHYCYIISYAEKCAEHDGHHENQVEWSQSMNDWGKTMIGGQNAQFESFRGMNEHWIINGLNNKYITLYFWLEQLAKWSRCISFEFYRCFELDKQEVVAWYKLGK